MEQVKSLSAVFAERLQEWRKRRKLTLRELADRMTDPIDFSTIHKIESGRREVRLDEALQFAAALNVPPPLLLLPLGTDDRVRIDGDSIIHPHLAWEWLAGEGPLTDSERQVRGAREWHESALTLRLYRATRKVQGSVQDANARVRRAEYAQDEDEARTARAAFAESLQELADLHDEMERVGVRAPRGYPDEWVEAMVELGIREA
jgi:transcriptional regulator with XRE-family HTH domain